MDLSVDEMYELQLSITKKLRNEMLGRKITEQRMKDWVGKGSIEVDNILLCELNSCEVRIHLLEDLLAQLKDAFVAAQAQENRVWRRAKKLQEVEPS
jgi:hypothetical protein